MTIAKKLDAITPAQWRTLTETAFGQTLVNLAGDDDTLRQAASRLSAVGKRRLLAIVARISEGGTWND